ncbi:MAG: carboxypeptidase-like regulatory domain-containing protein [Gemmatimonadota bacterium]
MHSATARVTPLWAVAALCTLVAGAPAPCSAQVLRGLAKTLDASRPIEQAQVFALTLDGKAVGKTTTGGDGRFYLRVDARGEPFVVSVRRIGMQPTTSDRIVLTKFDTLDVEFLVTESGVFTDTVRVTATPTLNDVRLDEAKRRGWKIFSPAQVAERRENVQSFGDLIRTMGYPGLIVPRGNDECIRTTRYEKCIAIVVDGVVLGGGNPLINPRDVHFMAMLSASDATVQFGGRAPWGALMVYTRMNGDKIR